MAYTIIYCAALSISEQEVTSHHVLLRPGYIRGADSGEGAGEKFTVIKISAIKVSFRLLLLWTDRRLLCIWSGLFLCDSELLRLVHGCLLVFVLSFVLLWFPWWRWCGLRPLQLLRVLRRGRCSIYKHRLLQDSPGQPRRHFSILHFQFAQTLLFLPWTRTMKFPDRKIMKINLRANLIFYNKRSRVWGSDRNIKHDVNVSRQKKGVIGRLKIFNAGKHVRDFLIQRQINVLHLKWNQTECLLVFITEVKLLEIMCGNMQRWFIHEMIISNSVMIYGTHRRESYMTFKQSNFHKMNYRKDGLHLCRHQILQ